MYDLLILGAGPAGLTAGIYGARGGLKTVIVERKSFGGQASITPEIENFPGIANIDGFTLTFNMQEQAKALGVTFVYDEVESVVLEGAEKSVTTKNNGEIKAKTLIIACGAESTKLGVDNEIDLIGKGVSYCATCDGRFFKNKPVAVVGGGNTAVEDALYLSNFASEVYLIHRRDSLRASKILQDKLFSSNVKILWNSIVEKLEGNPLVKIVVKNTKTAECASIDANCLFVAIGQTPASAQFLDKLKSENGYILADENMQTNIAGVYVAGDIRKTPLRQIITACADGAIAADSAIKYLM
ncbi:MAG: thioredoxin-disulfide reductase [Clostridia bacterium]|nr:thioredoxin-disulfide reductase [Clostridia bacterium]